MWRHFLVALVSIAFITSTAFAHDADEPPRPLVQIALLLDTSNSMDGLIKQAQTQLWTIVNETARHKRDGRQPRLMVALYEYGNSRLPVTGGYIRQVLPLTDDLDRISEKLFALTTCGGDEYCGQAIQHATRELEWSTSPRTFKAIFIAGNEPFTQGSVDYRRACRDAIERGIVVNTIHCGSESAGVQGGWRDGARLAEGKAMNINQDAATVAIRCPQDEIILKLSVELNSTYVPFGKDGARGAECQVAQDGNALSCPTSDAPVQRALSKAGAAYSNSSWDLVDAKKEGKDITKVSEEELPETLRKLNVEERGKYVEAQATRRADLQKQIKDLNAERDKYIASQQKVQSDAPETLESAVVGMVRDQLKTADFQAP